MHQVQLGFTYRNARTALFNYLLPAITAVLSLFVLKTQTVNVMWKTESALSLKTCVGWVLIGMRVQKLTSNTVNQSVWIFTKSMLIGSWQKARPKSYVTEEELVAERERQEAAGETPRYINEYLGMSEDEKTAIAEREAAGIVPTVCLAVNEAGIYKWNDMVKGEIEFEGGNIGGDWVIQKRDGYPTYNFCRCH